MLLASAGLTRGPWRHQSFGKSEGGANPPTASLLAALDLQRTGVPSLVIRRAGNRAGSTACEKTEELLLVRLAKGQDQFSVQNRLTIHEY